MKVPIQKSDHGPRPLGYTKKSIAAATGRSIPTLEKDARDPNCPLKFQAVPGQRAKLADPESYERYLKWIASRKAG